MGVFSLITEKRLFMTIRRAENRDIPSIGELLVQVCAVHAQGRSDLFNMGARKYNDKELEELIADDERPIFVACDEQDSVLGYAFCVFQQSDGKGALTAIKTLYIDDLCVYESLRGQHIGSALYEYVKSFAKEQGCYNVTLNVWACNESAMKFYEKCGMSVQKIGMETVL